MTLGIIIYAIFSILLAKLLHKIFEESKIDEEDLSPLHCTSPAYLWIMFLLSIPISYMPLEKIFHTKFFETSISVWTFILILCVLLWLFVRRWYKKYNYFGERKLEFHRFSAWSYWAMRIIISFWGLLIVILSRPKGLLLTHEFYKLPIYFFHWVSIQCFAVITLILLIRRFQQRRASLDAGVRKSYTISQIIVLSIASVLYLFVMIIGVLKVRAGI